ncbi:methyltransferase domain-containing protein [Flavobacteriales bacterium DA487]
MRNRIDFQKANVVVEYGAGNGVFSKMLAANMHENSKLILFETNEDFVRDLKNIFSGDDRIHVVCENALDVCKVLNNIGIDDADYIITGIPFTFLDDKERKDLIQNSFNMLSEGGRLISYQFSMTVNKYVKNQFGGLKMSVQPLNIPPLLVVEGVKDLS